MKDIQPNDVLIDRSIVTSKIKVLSKDLIMYELNGIIISGCHIVKYDNKWIAVYDHPEAIKLNYYDEPYLYCLNTTSKIIRLNTMEFADWDEVYGDNLEVLLKQTNIKNETQFSEMFNEGFNNICVNTKHGYKCMANIMVGEELVDGSIVYGIVELTTTNNLGKNKLCNLAENKLCNLAENKLFNLLVSSGIFETEKNGIQHDYNWKIDTCLEVGRH